MRLAGLILGLVCFEAASNGDTLNFDSINTSAAPYAVDILSTTYFQQYGITVSIDTPGTTVLIACANASYNNSCTTGTGTIAAPSKPNVLMQQGNNNGEAFTLSFKQPLSTLSFTRAGFNARDSGVVVAAWTVTAYDIHGNLLASASEPLSSYFSNVAPKIYVLNGPGIAMLRVFSNVEGVAAVSLPIDDLSSPDLVPVAPPTSPVVQTKVTSASPGIVNNTCTTPPAQSQFSTTSPFVDFYFDVTGAVSGDFVNVNFYRPDGALFMPESIGPFTPAANGGECFDFPLAIDGTDAASFPGTWTVKAFWDDSPTPLISLNFTIAAPGPASPSITSVSSAALPNTSVNTIAAGEMITIKGTNLGPAAPESFSVTGGFVSSMLGSVIVIFDGIAGTPLYVSPTQINVVVPWEIAGRTSTNMVVSFNGVESAIVALNVAAVAPAIFTQNASGSGAVVAINLAPGLPSIYNGPAGGTYGGTSIPTAPAPGGSTIVLLLTGGGVTSPPGSTGFVTPGTTLMPLKGWTPGTNIVTATIGGEPAVVQFAGAAPDLVTGVVQINLQMPDNVSGPSLPIVISINGVQTQGTATIAVAGNASPLEFTASTLPPATIGVNYSFNFCSPASTPCGAASQQNPSGGDPPYHFQLDSGSSAPPGLTLSANGILSGIPSGSSATYPFRVCAVDWAGTSMCVNESLVVNSAPVQSFTLTITASPSNGGTAAPAAGMTGTPCGAGCWSYAAGSMVNVAETANSGWTFAGWSGGCSGTGACTVKLSSNLSVTASFKSAGGGSGAGIPLQIPLPQGFSGCIDTDVNRTYINTANLVAWGGQVTSGYTWTTTPGSTLPAGIGLDTFGFVKGNGSPAIAGNYVLSLTVNDAAGTEKSAQFPLQITRGNAGAPCANADFQQSNGTFPDAVPNQAYAAQLPIVAGPFSVLPLTWTLAGGSLPTGLILDQSTGVIRGTPLASGAGQNFNFTISVTDSSKPPQMADPSPFGGGYTIRVGGSQ